jgi:hypothetical protein
MPFFVIAAVAVAGVIGTPLMGLGAVATGTLILMLFSDPSVRWTWNNFQDNLWFILAAYGGGVMLGWIGRLGH